ncbi:ATP-binding protein [Rubrivirga sp. S365]|uniref:ATP-binding protein n=1 Tax=Rubrivirga litoralis TaxID=3075598 RepID=A0ABU3BSD7_9BACT|nr:MULTISPECIES: ATP-binding protein [unclassified Rubrivirga]MDT0632183.1 ATP-binding protein [Rubrivirga sp. F394]MDT7856793.1 ATP-binding protein [Rubrivirga sp. S365]
MPSFHFHDFDRVIDQVHDLFDAWAEADTFRPVLEAEGLDVLRLAVHEWVANLVQHASFPGSRDVWLTVEADGDGVRCAVEDSSAGFDFTDQLARQREALDRPAPSERGRGLLMLITCAEDLGYRPARPGVNQRVTFTVRGRAGGALDVLFRAADRLPSPGGDGAPPDGLPPAPPP